jgi:hypothetical protein
MLHFVACAIAKQYMYSCGQINPQKATHQIDRICGAREYCAVMSALFIGVQGSTPFIDDVEEKFWAIIAENLRHCIQRCSCSSSRCALHHSQKQQGPTTTATCYVVRAAFMALVVERI